MKRSTQVGLVLMSALGVGGTAYMLMPGRDCRPPDTPEQAALHAPLTPGAAAAAVPAQQQNCAPRGSSGSSGRWSSSGSSWWHGSSSSSSGQTGPVVAKAASGTASSAASSSGIGATLRSGFGSFGRAMSSGG
ncbi:hypothetical protein CCR97_08540 [Rhodoplanes elegans]|uniref:Uncharacterized protein n=1 Tax=Rhodoplanes elegans TaxID=29408 RepID=A0A327KMI3_9BRAD|nr:hypothetical protein [Rhodoplanes elegans]MBK5958257.1 hypothetical protein [Rhodoplanes elegans]RAI40029.1 hypothetical protein CH338_07530 [Rhodoplanes elegans]